MKDGNASQTAAATGEPGPAAASPDLSGRTLGDFHVLRRLGEGGMGQVYLAEQLSLKRKVALKILRADLAADPIALKRFRAEAEAVARATHANIVQVYAIEEREGLHYMALEYVEGRNLRQYLVKKGSLETLLALSVMRQVAAALQRASELGIIHRDVKPENILLTRKGEVKVADFGLSRVRAGDQPPLNLTQSGVSMGTPLYMSPEQVQGQPVDPRTDIYSFGVTSYHMLAGQPPFQGKTPFEVALHHVNSLPTPLTQVRPDLPPDLCAIVHKMMAKEPAQRYQTCGDLLKDLARVREAIGAAAPGQLTQAISLDSVSGLLAPPPPVSASVPTQAAPPRRSLVPALFAATVVLALATGAGAAWLLRTRGTPAPTTEMAGTAPADAKPAELMSLREREDFLKKAVELYAANPGKDPSQIRRGLESLVDLGLFYLEQGRLKEADELFNDQESTEVRPFRAFGRLGHAIVLALENRAAESNRLLLEVLVEERPGPGRAELYIFLNQNPKLRQWIATAIDYNADNGVPPSAELNLLRKPTPRLAPPGPRPGAPMDK